MSASSVQIPGRAPRLKERDNVYGVNASVEQLFFFFLQQKLRAITAGRAAGGGGGGTESGVGRPSTAQEAQLFWAASAAPTMGW